MYFEHMLCFSHHSQPSDPFPFIFFLQFLADLFLKKFFIEFYIFLFSPPSPSPSALSSDPHALNLLRKSCLFQQSGGICCSFVCVAVTIEAKEASA